MAATSDGSSDAVTPTGSEALAGETTAAGIDDRGGTFWPGAAEFTTTPEVLEGG
jgi:hypothetical protein